MVRLEGGEEEGIELGGRLQSQINSRRKVKPSSSVAQYHAPIRKRTHRFLLVISLMADDATYEPRTAGEA